MKLNWGIGAFTLFGGFVVFIIIMVVLASNQTHELVTEDYYEKELEFKEVLVKKERVENLNADLSWVISDNELVVNFPVDNTSEVTGVILFFKPSSKNDDKKVSFTTDKQTLKLDVSEFSSGMYKMKIDWKHNHTEYFSEHKIDIPQ